MIGKASFPGPSDWVPPKSFEEKIRGVVVPPGLYVRHRAWQELQRGEPELRLIPFLVPRGRRVVDAGANVGVWSRHLGRVATEVEAFEPNPKIFRLLRGARLPRVRAHQVALSDAAGQAELRVPRGRKGYSNQGASLSAVKVAGAHGVVRVETRRLDDYAFDDVGFIKIDVEGFELNVLRGAAKTVAACRPTLVIEMEETHTRRPIEEQIAEVEGYGYEGFALRHGALTRTAAIDFVAHHRQPASRSDYIFNFIFLPR